MRIISEKQILSILALPGPERYKHFIKVVADTEEVWGLYSDGWALAATDDDETVFPLWPAKEYAQLCAVDIWLDYKPEVISLSDLMEELLPKLNSENIFPGIFYTPNNKGVTVPVKQLLEDLSTELENYK